MQRLQGGRDFLFPRCRRFCPGPLSPPDTRRFSRWRECFCRLRTVRKLSTYLLPLSRKEAQETAIFHRLTHSTAILLHTIHMVHMAHTAALRPAFLLTETFLQESLSLSTERRLPWEACLCPEVKWGKAEMQAAEPDLYKSFMKDATSAAQLRVLPKKQKDS